MFEMSIKNKDSMYWAKNEDWYFINKEKQRFELTGKAPEEARRSFEKYKRMNKEYYLDLVED